MKIAELLDEVKAKTGEKSDGALARKLGVTKQAVSKYYNDERAPDEFVCLRISEITGKPLDTVIATVKAASEKDDTRREAWENYMKRLGGIAASFLITLCVTVTMLVTLTPGNASAATVSGGDTLYYVNNNPLKDQFRSSSFTAGKFRIWIPSSRRASHSSALAWPRIGLSGASL